MRLRVLICLIILCLARSADYVPTPDVDGIEAVRNFSEQRLRNGEKEFEQLNLNRFPSPASWTEDIVYSIQIDRFNNGDFSNDDLNLPPFQSAGSIYDANVDHSGIHDFRHGGDLQGIIDRLDYLKDLGVNSLWLTPFLKHTGDYHGYCVTSLLEVDPGFGTKEKLIELVQKAHNKGIKIIMDVVINHLCDRRSYYSSQPNHYLAVDTIATGNPQGQGQLSFSDSFFAPFKTQRFFNRAGPNSSEDMSGHGNAVLYGDFVDGMYDYNTNDPDFQYIFTNFIAYWIAVADIDAFRFDAAKHVTPDFIAYISSKIRNYARSLGKSNFYIVGEVAGFDDSSNYVGQRLGKMFTNPNNYYDHGDIPGYLTDMIIKLSQDSNPDPKYSTNFTTHSFFPHPGLNAVFDFSHGNRARSSFRGEANISDLANYFSSDYYNTIIGQSDHRFNWNVVEIHDWERFAVRDQKDNFKRSIASIAYLMTASGIPLIYYGQEQGFNQNGHWSNINLSEKNKQETIQIFSSSCDSLKRQDMFMGPWRLGSSIPALDNLSYVGTVDKTSYPAQDDPFLNTQHELYLQTKHLIRIRKSCKTLSDGQQYFRYGIYDNVNFGIIAYSRILEGEEIVVLINNSEGELYLDKVLVDSSINSNGKHFINLLNTVETGDIFKDANTSTFLQFSNSKIEANSYKIYVDVKNTKVLNSQVNNFLYESVVNTVCKN